MTCLSFLSAITFPGLGLEFNIDRVAFTLGKNIYWYGIIIAVGFLLGALYGYFTCPRYGIKRDDVIDLLIIATPSAIIGARLYYVIFYLDNYKAADGSFDWKAAIALWDGGLAIYGAVIAAVIALAGVCLYKKISFLAFADVGSLGLFIGQAVGRWGNFVNQEAYGTKTTLPWRMGLTVNGSAIEVHPTFLYESVWNALGFCIAHFFLRKRRRFDGQIFCFYLAWYGVGRFFIEGLRTDSLYLFGSDIRVSQMVALVTAVGAIAVMIWKLTTQSAKNSVLYVDRVAAVTAAGSDTDVADAAADAGVARANSDAEDKTDGEQEIPADITSADSESSTEEAPAGESEDEPSSGPSQA